MVEAVEEIETDFKIVKSRPVRPLPEGLKRSEIFSYVQGSVKKMEFPLIFGSVWKVLIVSHNESTLESKVQLGANNIITV